MIAIPDFPAGAMENWGLITYKESAMLYQPGLSSEGNKQWVATVVSHELAHQVYLYPNKFVLIHFVKIFVLQYTGIHYANTPM